MKVQIKSITAELLKLDSTLNSIPNSAQHNPTIILLFSPHFFFIFLSWIGSCVSYPPARRIQMIRQYSITDVARAALFV